MPVLFAVTLALVWLLSVGAAQIRTVDAARESARALARGDAPAEAIAVGERVAPDGVSVTVHLEGDQVRAYAEGRIAGPGGLLQFLPGAVVQAEAVAVAEEGAGP